MIIKVLALKTLILGGIQQVATVMGLELTRAEAAGAAPAAVPAADAASSHVPVDYDDGHTCLINVNLFMGVARANLYHGRGTRNYREGEAYEGDYVDGHREGKGKLTYPRGVTYFIYVNLQLAFT